MNKMKVLHFIHSMGVGGAQVPVKDYALFLDKNKFDVTVLCIERENTFLDDILRKNNIRTVYVSDLFPLKKVFRCNNLILKVFQKMGVLKFFVKFLIHKEKPDIIHYHLLCSNYIKFANVPQSCTLIHTIHSQPEKYWCVNQRSAKKDYNALNYLIHNRGVQLIAINNQARDVANELFGVDDTIVLNNAIDFSKFQVAETKNDIRDTLGIDRNAYLVGNIGRFSPVKNHALIVRAFSELCKLRDDARLLLVGDGELRAKIKTEIETLGLKEKVIILNARTDVARILKALDVFIFASKYEGLGIILIEAQKMGVPCVISNAIPQEAVISNLVHRMDENATPADYARILNDFQVNKVEYNGLEEWDMKVVIKQLENVYIRSKIS